MNKVASTDQLGRLISLAGSAIDLVREGNRSAEQTDALLDAIQTFKDPNRTPKSVIGVIGCCGYPHYDDPKRPSFGSNQVRDLCQLRPGLQIRKHMTPTDVGRIRTVVSKPFRHNGEEYYKIIVRESNSEYEEFLEDANVIPCRRGEWHPSYWYTFIDPPKHYNYHNHTHYCNR